MPHTDSQLRVFSLFLFIDFAKCANISAKRQSIQYKYCVTQISNFSIDYLREYEKFCKTVRQWPRKSGLSKNRGRKLCDTVPLNNCAALLQFSSLYPPPPSLVCVDISDFIKWFSIVFRSPQFVNKQTKQLLQDSARIGRQRGQ